jgi:hypothetical protein
MLFGQQVETIAAPPETINAENNAPLSGPSD